MALTSTLGSLLTCTNTSNETLLRPSPQLVIVNQIIQPQSHALAEVGEQRVVISGVEASVSDDNYSDVGFGSAAVPNQVVIGILQSRGSPCSASDPLQSLHCILNSGK